ncbi:hypothetical protein GGI26_004952 [Coemansia sp. RSA 1358]|nr:hypothetical protein GGI26_004952 [Coemansia sp. RSA 1358]
MIAYTLLFGIAAATPLIFNEPSNHALVARDWRGGGWHGGGGGWHGGGGGWHGGGGGWHGGGGGWHGGGGGWHGGGGGWHGGRWYKWAKLSGLGLGVSGLRWNLYGFLEFNHKVHGNLFVIGPNAVATANLEDCKLVLSTHSFTKADMYQVFAVITDTIIPTKSVELAKTRRKQLAPTLANSHIRQMEHTILDYGFKSIKQKWDTLLASSSTKETAVNYMEHLFLCAFDILGMYGFGQQFNALKEEKTEMIYRFGECRKIVAARAIFGPLISYFPFSLYTRKASKSVNNFIAFANNVIGNRRAMVKGGKAERPKDLLQNYMDTESPESTIKITPTQITVEPIVLYIGGVDTASETLV